jgi:hypothetical protein
MRAEDNHSAGKPMRVGCSIWFRVIRHLANSLLKLTEDAHDPDFLQTLL